MNMKYDHILTERFLISEYIDKRKSSHQIAREIGSSKTVILCRLRKCNIERRKVSDLNKERAKLFRGKNHPSYKHGKSYEKAFCIDCGKELSHHAFYNNYKKCSSCWSKTRIGSLNPNWKENKEFKSYPLGWNNTFREQIRYRDEYKCKLCEKPEIENRRKLDVHHIDYDKNNLKLNNLISLCHSCHSRTHHNRGFWKTFFQKNVHGIFEVM